MKHRIDSIEKRVRDEIADVYTRIHAAEAVANLKIESLEKKFGHKSPSILMPHYYEDSLLLDRIRDLEKRLREITSAVKDLNGQSECFHSRIFSGVDDGQLSFTCTKCKGVIYKDVSELTDGETAALTDLGVLPLREEQ